MTSPDNVDRRRSRLVRGLRGWVRELIGLAIAITLTIVLGYGVVTTHRLPDLSAWHELELASEFDARQADIDFDDYLALETRLFAELDARLTARADLRDDYIIGRYNPQSLSRQAVAASYRNDYNRSFVLAPAQSRGSVLLVHGLSDSPYSMRGLAESFQRLGFHAVVLRLPGHGTVPAGIARASWQDWMAAVRIAARHARSLATDGQPFYAVGYSTGATLLLLHTLEALTDPSLPRPQRLFLLSPAVGLTKAAALGNVVRLAAIIPAFAKVEWVDVLPEYDPYKYNSFPLNAANQVYALSRRLQRALAQARETGTLAHMPPVLAFQSLVDATVSTRDVVVELFARLPRGDHELVLFDMNQFRGLQGLNSPALRAALERLENVPSLDFRLLVVGNRDPAAQAIVVRTREPGAREFTATELGMDWPDGVISVGHVAMPFRPDDPLYGLDYGRAHRGEVFQLGAVSLIGEPGALVIPLEKAARLRSNPFFGFMESRIEAALARDRPP